MFHRVLLLIAGCAMAFAGFFAYQEEQMMMGRESIIFEAVLDTPQVHADQALNSQGQTAKKQDDPMRGFTEVLSTILKLLYFLLWPILLIAGQAMNNDLVYGGIFHLDITLFQFRNIIKNFANYALGFIFLYYLLKNLITQNASDSPVKVLPKLLIGGVLVQASWWLFAALIDLSTVATYGIGGLPMTVIGNDQIGKQPVLGTHSTMKLSDLGDKKSNENDYKAYFSYGEGTGTEKFLPCIVTNSGTLTGFIDPQIRQYVKEFPDDPPSISAEYFAGREGFNQEYCVLGNQLMKFNPNVNIYEIGGTDLLKQGTDYLTSKGGLTIETLIKRGKGLVGPFFALYGSLLNMGALNVTAENKTIGGFSIEFLLKALVAIALLVPLVALAVVLIMRIGFLWVAIAFSPLLVLSQVFGWNWESFGKFSVSNIITLIFLPVVVTLTLSISIIFLSALQSMATEKVSGGGSILAEKLGFTTTVVDGNSCIKSEAGNVTSCITKSDKDLGLSPFLDSVSWIIVNLFGIGLMRTIVFTAFEFSKFTEAVAGQIKTIGKGFAQAAPIIPVPGVGAVGVGGLSKGIERITSAVEGGGNASEKQAESIKNFIETGEPNKEFSRAIKSLGDVEGKTGASELSAGLQAFKNSPQVLQQSAPYKEAVQGAITRFTGASQLSSAFANRSFQEALSKTLTGDEAASLYSGLGGNAGDVGNVIAAIDTMRACSSSNELVQGTNVYFDGKKVYYKQGEKVVETALLASEKITAKDELLSAKNIAILIAILNRLVIKDTQLLENLQKEIKDRPASDKKVLKMDKNKTVVYEE